MTGYLTKNEFSSFDEIISGNNNFSHATPLKKGLKLPSRFASFFSGKKGKKEKVDESLESDAENSPKTSQDDEEENLINQEEDNTSVSSTKSSMENIKENTDKKRNGVIFGNSSKFKVLDTNTNSDAETDEASGSGENKTSTTSGDEKTMI